MVALVVSALLVMGIIQIFISTRESHRVQTGMAYQQENARVAMDLLRHDLSMAGNPRTPGISPFDTVRSTDGAGVDSSDTIAPVFQTGVDCFGNVLAPNTVSTHVYTVQQQADGTWSLFCATNANFAAPQPVVDGIEGMQVLYGRDSDGDLQPDSYVGAGGMLATDWPTVASVRIALLVNTMDPVSRTNSGPQTYYLLGAPGRTFNDQLRRQVYTFTVLIRNGYGATFF
jgi:type IV pilus assembly protein PilW